ncbi:membrane-bound O-acyltransferase family protein [Sporanaerobium hydrogeniformans]|uniref:Membrane-bound O-acyltransferase family protein n=1 Tax=Sporanaerobium hydrogeniformans TaxID=3072179 RepID=A0AC61DBD0_9FIRM|nr:MBOAT family O-acyltransferase [Sporanaerobium hydrogeniformans]PHV70332.1 membrane-bound O-acyltransferase family protein [Sporanaerobium hydrogeniformans]
MVFNSFHFLLFFPIVTVIYFLIPHKVRWAWLLMVSYYFYMCWNPVYALLILLSTLLTYLSGLLIEQAKEIKKEKKAIRLQKLWVILSFSLNLGILFFFKYFNFFIENINKIIESLSIQLVVPSFDVLLPVGISFYTFQALSYTMDVYRGEIKAEKHFGKYALFVSFFPQLVAGPIEKSKALLGQFNEVHSFEYERAKRGLLLMLWGLFQKLVIADRVAIVVNTVYNNYMEYAGIPVIVATLLFAVQIYCDFSSYSDIAIGASEVMGFKLMDNFKRPYFSKSIAEFWRRWHVSLGSWFRDYLYIPLGGSRKGTFKKYRNILIVFLCSGLWHGASWNFVIWGFLHGFYQVLGMSLKPVRDYIVAKLHIKRGSFWHKLYQISVVFILVDLAWIFFRAATFSQALGIIKRLFVYNPWTLWDGSLYQLGLDPLDFIVGLIAIALLLSVSLLRRKMSLRNWLLVQPVVIRWTAYFTFIYMILIFGIYGPGYEVQPFIYFQF